MVRPLEHSDENEIFNLTESRHEPASELHELVESSQVMDFIPEHIRDCLWTGVDDGETVWSYRPEQRVDAEGGLQLLTLGLVFERLVRNGNTYLLNGAVGDHGSGDDFSSTNNGCIGKSFEAAVERLQSDGRLADQV